jgi:hypothetical protein
MSHETLEDISFYGVDYVFGINDELVKSHIPYVVHASTKPVLSEPSTLRPFDRSTGSRLTAQGERFFRMS